MKFRILALLVVTFISANVAVGQSVWLNGNGIRLRNGDVSAVGAVNGNIYYDIGLNQFRFYENGAWKTLSTAAPVSSVFGRTGAVTAQSSDYSSFYLPLSLTPGHIFVGNVSSVATDVAMSGDVTLSSAGITAIGSGKVTNSMLSGSIAASKLVGTDIGTVGTITSGTWNGTAIADAYISSASAWNAKISSQWTTTASDIYFGNKVLIGATGSPAGILHTVTTSTSAPRGVIFDQYNSGTNSSRAYFRKARGTFASPGVITTGDALGNLTFAGYDGSNFTDAAQFLITSSGTISTGIVQSTMALQTANASGTLTSGLLLDGSQQVGIGAAPSNTRFHITGAGTTTGIAFKVDDNSGNNRVSVADNGNSSFTQSAQSSSSPNFITFTPGAHTGLTSSTEASDILFNLNRTVQFTSGALTTQRAIYVRAPTYAFTSASTLASASTFAISGAPSAGTNATITDPYALSVEGGRILFSTSGGSTTKGDVTISDGSSSGKLLFDIKKSNSVFSVYQEGRTVWANASLSLAANTGFMESVGTNTLTFNYSTTGDAGYYIKHSPSLAIAAGATSTEFAYFYRANPSVAFGTTSTPFWMFDLNPSTTGTPGSLYGVTVRPTNFNNGFGTGTPTSTVQVNGSFASAFVSKTGSYTLTSTDGTVEVTSGTNTQTLPTAVGCAGRWYYITNSGSGTVTVATTSSQTFINISGTPTSMSLTQFQTWAYQSNGTNWLAFKEY